MRFNPSSKVRALLYALTAIGTPLVAYLAAKGYLGDLEVQFWSAEVTVVSAMAALNVSKPKEK